MSEAASDHPKAEREPKSWRDQLPTIVATAIAGGVIAATVTWGGQLVKTGTTADVLVSKVERIEKQNDTQEQLLRDVLKAQAAAYTREEARADREAAERRFQSLEGRIGDLGRRIEMIERSYLYSSPDKGGRR